MSQVVARKCPHCLQVSISTDPTRSVEITDSDSVIVDYTYSVKWEATETPFEKRMDKYRKYQFLPQHLEVMSQPCSACLSASPGHRRCSGTQNAPAWILLPVPGAGLRLLQPKRCTSRSKSVVRVPCRSTDVT